MIKKLLPTLSVLLILGFLLPVIGVLAAYTYYIPVTISNNSTTDYTYLPVLVDINNTQLSDLGYMDSDGLNTDMVEGASTREFMVGGNRTGVIIPSLLGNQQTAVNYRLGDDVGQTDFPIIVGMGGNFTVDDAAGMELGNNFTLEYSGYIDTGAVGGDLVSKEGAIRTYISGGGTIIASTNYTETQETRDSFQAIYGGQRMGQRFDSFVGDVDEVQFYLCNQNFPTGTAYVRIWAVSDNSTIGTLGSIDVSTISGCNSYAWYSFNNTVNVGTQQDIRVAFEFDSGSGADNVAVGFWSTVGNQNDGVRTYYDGSTWTDYGGSKATFRLWWSKSVTATGISSGEHTVIVGANVTAMRIEVDGSEQNSIALTGPTDCSSILNLLSLRDCVVDNGNSWVFMSNNVTPYLNYYYHDVDRVREAWYQPNTMVIPTNLPDRTGNGNTGTINWGTNPTGIELTIGQISPISAFVSAAVNETLPEIVRPINQTWSENATADTSGLWMFPSFNRAANSLGWGVGFTYSVFMLMGAMSVGVAGWIGLRSSWGFVMGFGGTAALAASTGVFPLWLAVLSIVGLVVVVYAWSRF
jgi:hypothetical protein